LKQKAYADSALGLSNEAWVTVNPHVLLFVFLPVLIFESAINCEWHIFKRQVDHTSPTPIFIALLDLMH
jgi:hypothetical protein